MKAWIGKYNAHKGQKVQTDQLQIEFLQADWHRVAEILGQAAVSHWNKLEIDLSADHTGVIVRSSPAGSTGLHLTHKQPPKRVDGTQRHPRMSIARTAILLSGLNRLPEFSMGEVEAQLDFDGKFIFIPLIPEADRKPVRKQVRGARSRTAPTALARAAAKFAGHGERGPDGQRGTPGSVGRLESARIMPGERGPHVGEPGQVSHLSHAVLAKELEKLEPPPVTSGGVVENLREIQLQLDELIADALEVHNINVTVRQDEPGAPVKFSFQF